MLAFEIIYCSSVYNLYDGLPKPKSISKSKKQTVVSKLSIENLYENYCAAKDKMDMLDDVPEILESELQPGAEIVHKKFGHGQITSYQNGNLEIQFGENQEHKTLKAYESFYNKIIALENVEANIKVEEAFSYITKRVSIKVNYENAKNALEPYKKELEEMGINL